MSPGTIGLVHCFDSDSDRVNPADSNQRLAVIKLNNGTVMYLREVTKLLALVCILREDSFEKRGLIDFNFLCFRQGITDVFSLGKKQVLENGDTSMNGIIEAK
ncbi:hypothetical protein DPMN_071150 [Dreissena polymorpha]|uniref:Uncharacterized protein n=1 Tax=Dreissena polymorpha TaxID=45954 RepID=A0A9D4BPE2_DREPO|nr:hypothetical protein DPMN_071150 [Dreissena polymorpha]